MNIENKRQIEKKNIKSRLIAISKFMITINLSQKERFREKKKRV